MAKKFASVKGLHSLFDYNSIVIREENQDQYDILNLKSGVSALVDKNTICFITADEIDEGRYIGNMEIADGDRFIITQKTVFAQYKNPVIEPEQEPEPEDPMWRPLYFNGEVIGEKDEIDFIDSNYIKVVKEQDVINDEYFRVQYNLDTEALFSVVKEMIDNAISNIVFPEPIIPPIEVPTPNDGILTFEKGHNSEELQDNSILVTTEKETQEEEPQEGAENFSANTPDNFNVKIKYTGNADRIDWHIDQDTRLVTDRNDTKAKKFLYVEPLHEYFQQNGFPNVISVQSDKKHLISQDSIVFITCGESYDPATGIIMSDEKYFNNPEFAKGARFIWTQNRLFSCNTWMPLFTKATSDPATPEFQVSPVIGDNAAGHGQFAKLVIEGKGGIVIDNTTDGNTKYITIDGSRISTGGSGGIGVPIIEGPGIVIHDNIEGNKICVQSPQGEQTIESEIDDKTKNFIHFEKLNPNDPSDIREKIVVNGVDASHVYIDEEIDISGTALAQIAIENGDFDDWKTETPEGPKYTVPVGTSVQDLFNKLLHKEIPEVFPNLNSVIAEVWDLLSSVKMDVSYKPKGTSVWKTDFVNNGNYIPGTEFALTITKHSSGKQRIRNLSCATDGYKLGTSETGPTGDVESASTIDTFVPKFLENGELTPIVTSQGFREGNVYDGNITELESSPSTNTVYLKLDEPISGGSGAGSYTAKNTPTIEINPNLKNIRIYPLSNKHRWDANVYREIVNSGGWNIPSPITGSTSINFKIPAEDYGSQSLNKVWKIVGDEPSVSVIGPTGAVIPNNAEIPVGTQLTMAITKGGTVQQSATVGSFIGGTIGGVEVGGYKIGSTAAATTHNASYGASFTGESAPIFIPDSNKTRYTGESGYVQFGITGGTIDNQLQLTVQAGGTNSIVIVNKCSAQCGTFDPITLYPVSNWNNVDEAKKINISMNDFAQLSAAKTLTFRIRPLYPYFIGAIGNFADMHDFSTEDDHAAFILSHIGTNDIKFREYDLNVPDSIPNLIPNEVLGDVGSPITSRQFVIVVPASKVAQNDWIKILDSENYNWTNIDDASFKASKNTINMYGEQYKVFTITAKRSAAKFEDGTLFNATIYK